MKKEIWLMLSSERNKKDGIFSLSRAWDKEKKEKKVSMTSLATRLPVAQWLEHPTGVREVMGLIPVGDSDFFFVPRS